MSGYPVGVLFEVPENFSVKFKRYVIFQEDNNGSGVFESFIKFLEAILDPILFQFFNLDKRLQMIICINCHV